MAAERDLSATSLPDGSGENADPSTAIASLPSREQMLEMTPAERGEVISRARKQYAAAEKRASKAMSAMRDVPRDSEQAAQVEREYVASLQELGTTVGTVIDAREIDEIGDVSSDFSDEDLLEAIRATRSRYPEAVLAYTKLYQAVEAGDTDGEAEYRKVLRDLPPGKRPTGTSAFKTLHNSMEKSDEVLRDKSASLRRKIIRDELGNFGPFGGVSPAAKFTRLSKADRAAYDESMAMYPDELVERAWEVSPPVEVKKTTARARYSRAIAFGPLRDAQIFHHPTGHGDLTPETLAVAADRIRVTGSPVHGRSLTTNSKNIGWLQNLNTSRFQNVDSMFMKDTPENRAALEDFAQANNDAPGKTRDMAVTEMELPGRGKCLVLTNAGGPFHADSRTPVSSVSSEITTDGTVSTSVHELAHRMENNDDRIGRACRRFIADRTEGLSARRYGRSERVVEDSFVSPYVGKRYDAEKNATEVLAVGMEAISTGKYGGLTGRKDPTEPGVEYVADPEHRSLVLGLLAGLAGPGKR